MMLKVRFIGSSLIIALLLFTGSFVNAQTVTSDKNDYAPLSNAVFTGSGFAPNEAVVLKVKNLTKPCNTVAADSSYYPWTVVADANGNFVTNWTVCNCDGDSLRLKAVGQTSGYIAYAYFTDASLNQVTVGAASQTVTYGTGGVVTYSVDVKATGSGSGPTGVTLTTSGFPSGVTVAWSSGSSSFQSPNIINFPGGTATVNVTLSVTVPGNIDVPASSGFTVTATSGGTTKFDNTKTLTINPKSVTGSITASNKEYDGTTTATVTRSLTGVLFGDDVSLTGAANFQNANIGSQTVTATPLGLSGTKAGNYTLSNASATATAAITTKSLTATFTITNKVYDGTTAASITNSQLSGIVSGEENKVALNGGIAAFTDKHAGTNKSVTVTGATLSGSKASNYIIGTIVATANITTRPLTVTAQTDNRVYNGTTSSGVAPVVGALQTGDAIGTAPIQTYDTRNIGTNKTLTASGLIVNDGNGGNDYAVSYVTNNTGVITVKSINVTAQTDNRPYNGTTSSSVAPVVGALQSGDVIGTAPTQVYNTRNVGTGRILTASGLVINDGNSGNNYSISYVTNNTGVITARDINVTAQSDNRPYNGTTSSSVTPLVDALQTGDLVGTAPTQVFNTKHVGTGKTLTASGLVINDGNSGNNYHILYATNTTGVITVRDINVTAQSDSRVYNGTTSSSVAPQVDALQTGDLIGTAPTQSYDSKNVGTNKTLTASGLVINDGNSGNNYHILYSTNTTGIITVRDINVTAQADSRVYNGTTSSSVAPQVDALQTGDLVGTAPTQAYDTKNVGINKTLTASGLVINDGNSGNNYHILYATNTTGVITVRDINVTAQSDSRVYNGTTSSSVAPEVDALQTGDLVGTAPTQAYDTKNVGINKTLTASGLVINDGNSGNNYHILYATNTTGVITVRDINVTAQADSRVYNGTTSSSVAPEVDALQTGDLVGTAPTQAYDTKNVGSNKTLTASGLVINDGNSGNNYHILYTTNTTGIITVRDINVTAQTDSRVYNGTTSSSVAPEVDALQTGDLIGTAPTQAYDTKNVGSNKTLTASGLVINDGNSGNNYHILYTANNTGVITVRDINVTAQADSRVYNGTTSSSVAPEVDALQTGDLIGTAPTQAYDTKNVGSNKTLTASGLVINDGNSGNNYHIIYEANNTGVITTRDINVTAQTDSRVYNGTTSSSVAPEVDALQTGDLVSTAPTQSYDSKNVGVGKTLTASGLAINDGNSGNNYHILYATNTTGVITVRDINVTAQSDSRVYNGTTSSSVAPEVDALQTGDLVGTVPTQAYDTKNVGTNKTLTASGLVINDGNSGNNYHILYATNTTGVITVRDINVTAQTDSRVYNGTTSSGVAPQVDALQTGDLIGTAPTQAYDTKNVGTNKTLTASGLAINDGNSGNNYHILYAPNTTGVITVRDINVTAQTDSRVYNGTTSSSVAPQVDALQTGDLIGTAPTQSYDTKNVGTGKTLIASGLAINDGNSGNNYHILYTANNTGVITVRDINVTAQTDSRVYNGTTNSSVAPQVDALQTGDLVGTAPTQAYDTKNVGTNKTLTASGLVINDGNSGNNYHILYATNTTGVITVRDINVTAQSDSRIYNGTTSSSVAPQVDALQTGDLVGTAPTQSYDSKNVGTGKTLTANGLVINDGNSGNNYHILYTANNTGVITVRDINVTAQTDSRVYNGTTSSSVAPQVDALQTGDLIGTAPTQAYDTKNVGTGKTLTANGLVINDGNSGNNYHILYTTNTTGVISVRDINVTAQHDDRVYNGTTSSGVAPQVDALQTGDLIGTAPTQSYDSKNVGANKTLTASGLVINDGNSGNNYHILYATNTTGVITVRDINVTAQTDSRVYNGTTSSSVAPEVDALQTGDLVGTAPTQAYDTKNVGTNKTLTASGLVINDGNSGNNYHILYATNTTGVIAVRDINVTAQHDDRVYNGTTSSSVAPQVDALQTGDLIGTAPTQAYDTKNVGTGKTLTANGLVINDGNSGNNYHILYTTNTTGVISVRDINVTAQHDDRVYNGTTSSSVAPEIDALQTGDLIGTAPTQAYDTKNVGTNKTLTASGLVINDGNSGNNYHILYATNTTGVITVRDINVTAQSDSRVYNGTTSSSVAPEVDALQTGDLIGTAPTQSYDSKNVGTNKTLTASGLVINDGNSGNNYHILYATNTTGVITVRDINVTAQADSRVYNGTTSSSVAPEVDALQTGDLIGTAPTQSYDSKNVGTNKTLTASGLVINDGNSGNNYHILYATNTTGVITVRDINVTAQADSRVYNGTTSSGVAPQVDALQTGDLIGTAPTQVYDTKNVGSNKILTASGLVINDGNSGNNYHILYAANTTGIITVRDINVTAKTDSRMYNGTTSSGVAPQVDLLQTGDLIGTAPTQVYNTKNVGTNKTLTASGLVINDGNSGNNYHIVYTANYTGVITVRDINVTAKTDSRVYNGTTSSSVAPQVDALQTGDLIGTAPTQVYDTKNVGSNKTLTASGLVINDGNSGNNYHIIYTANNTGIITVRDINVTAKTDSRVYNGTTSSNVAPQVEALQTGDLTGTAPTQAYDTKNVGTGKTLTASGMVINDGNSGNNYHIIYTTNTTGAITIRDINVTAKTDSRMYNGTTSSGVAPQVDLLQTGDLIGTAPTQVYNTKNVGTNKTLTASGLVINDGNSGNNYHIIYTANNTGVITARDINVTAQHDERTYNGTTSSGVAPQVETLQNGDAIGTAPIQKYDTKNAGPGKTLTPCNLVINDGNSGLNYAIHYLTNTTGIIYRRDLDVTAQHDERVYNGNTSSSVVPVTGALQTGDVIGSAPIQTFNTKNVGTNKILTPASLVINDGNGGLNYLVHYLTDGTGIITAKGITGNVTANNKVYDGNRNATIANRTLTGVIGYDVVYYSGGAATFDDVPAGTGQNVGTNKPVTATGLSLTGADALNYSVNPSAATTANITTAGLTITANDVTAQYSDPVAFGVSYSGFASGEGPGSLGGSLTYTTTPAATTGTSPAIATGAPGGYTITPAGLTSGNYSITFKTGTLTITKEDAQVTYTGLTLVATTSPTTSTANLTLSATIQDITAVLGDPAYDGYAGDIRKATVTFNIDGVDKATVPIGLVNGADSKTGTAITTITGVGIGDHTVLIKLNGYYTGTAAGDNSFVVEVFQNTGDFITGGGYLKLTNSSGQKPGDAGTKNNFGFNIKYNKGGTNLQGTINTIIRRMEGGVLHVYQVKGNSMTSLTVNGTATPSTAVFNGKANVTDITNPANVISVGGNYTLQVSMTDAGEPGTNDMIGITVFNKDGGIWYTSNWNGTQTIQQTLAGGNLVVHGSNVGAAPIARTETPVQTATAVPVDPFIVKVYGNPTMDHFNISISGPAQKISLRVIDIRGRLIEYRENVPQGTLQLGDLYGKGFYYLEVWQGNHLRQLKLVKL